MTSTNGNFSDYDKRLQQEERALAISINEKCNELLADNLKLETMQLARNEIASRQMFDDAGFMDECNALFAKLVENDYVYNPFTGAYSQKGTEIILAGFKKEMISPAGFDYRHPFIPFFIALRMGFPVIYLRQPDYHGRFIAVFAGYTDSLGMFNTHFGDLSQDSRFHQAPTVAKEPQSIRDVATKERTVEGFSKAHVAAGGDDTSGLAAVVDTSSDNAQPASSRQGGKKDTKSRQKQDEANL